VCSTKQAKDRKERKRGQKEKGWSLMPLAAGKKNIGKNIETEMKHGKSHKQAVAIALDVAKRKH